MTPEQVQQIANKVRGTRQNVYRVAEAVVGHEVGEEIFDLLREQANLFKCEMCDEWLDVRHEGLMDICNDCLDGEDEPEFEDEE